MRNPTTTFRFSEAELRQLDGLAQLLETPRSEVMRGALSAFRRLILMGFEEGLKTHAELKRRYPGGLVVITLEQDPTGEPTLALRIDSNQPADVQAHAMFPPANDRAHIVLVLDKGDDRAAAQVELAWRLRLFAETGIVIGLHAGTLPWPPEPGRGLVLQIDDIEAGLPADARELLIPVEA